MTVDRQHFIGLCRWLFDTKFQFTEGVDEVHLLELSKEKDKGKFLETCYRQQPGEFGWCRTFGNFYEFSNDSVHSETRIATDWGWGFCSGKGPLDYPQTYGENNEIVH